MRCGARSNDYALEQACACTVIADFSTRTKRGLWWNFGKQHTEIVYSTQNLVWAVWSVALTGVAEENASISRPNVKIAFWASAPNCEVAPRGDVSADAGAILVPVALPTDLLPTRDDSVDLRDTLGMRRGKGTLPNAQMTITDRTARG
jgi:hypothetical protein